MLDCDAIRRRRLELGMSERALGRELGVSAGVIAALEQGRSHGALRLDFIERLATTLGISATALFASRPRPPRNSGLPEDRPQRVMTMLVMARGKASTAALAKAAGCTLPELREALVSINDITEPLGIQVVTTSTGLSKFSVSRSDASALSDAHAAAELSERGLSHAQARALWKIASGGGDATWQRQGGEGRRLAVGFLERSGLVTRNEGELVLTDAGRISLGTIVCETPCEIGSGRG